MAISVPNQRHTLIQYGNYLDSRFPSGAGVGGGSMVTITFDDRNVGSGPFFDAYGGANGTTTQVFGSGKSARCNSALLETDLDWLAGNPTHQVPLGGEVWWRFRTFFPTGYDFTGLIKFMRLQTAVGGAASGHLDIFFRDRGTGSDTTNVAYFDAKVEGPEVEVFGAATLPTGIVRGVWQTWNCYVKWHNVAASAKIRLWRDNQLIINTSAIATLPTASHYMGNASDATSGFMLMTFWNGSGSPASQEFYVDDWAISTSISGAPTTVDSNGYPWIGVGVGGVS